jgi:hypothetical protein
LPFLICARAANQELNVTRTRVKTCGALILVLVLMCLWLPILLPAVQAPLSLRQRWRKPLVLFPPRKECPNFLIVTSDAAGVGHRLGSIALAIALAGDSGAALVLDNALWLAPRSGPNIAPEDFEAFGDMFMLPEHFLTAQELGFTFNQQDALGTEHNFWASSFATPWGQVRPAVFPRVEATLEAVRRSCGLVSVLPTGHGACESPDVPGEPTYCLSVVQGGFERAASVIRALYARSALAVEPVPQFSALPPGTLAIAWHIRNGDIVLAHQSAALSALIAQVLILTVHLPVQHFVVSEHPIAPTSLDFGFLFKLPGFSFHLIHGLHFSRAFAVLAAADVLVHTGSSFALAAAAAADASQVFLMMLPKEAAQLGDRAYNVYRLSKGLPVQRNGSLLPEDAQEFSRRTAGRLAQRPLQWRSGAVPGRSPEALRLVVS